MMNGLLKAEFNAEGKKLLKLIEENGILGFVRKR